MASTGEQLAGSARLAVFVFAVGVVCSFNGCARPHKVSANYDGAPRYERVVINYRRPSTVRHVVATLKEPAADSNVRLRIEYPHPQGVPDKARATVWTSPAVAGKEQPREGKPLLFGVWKSLARGKLPTLLNDVQQASVNSEPGRAALYLDFPREQLDLLLIDLASSGFFETRKRPQPTANLDVQLDRGRTQRTWPRQPRLEDFIDRVVGNNPPPPPMPADSAD